MYNKVILIGNLTRDVEIRYTPSGTAIAKFGLATNRVYIDPTTKEKKQEVMFIDITMFGRSAETANQWLKKGKKVLIEGRLVFEQWTDNTGQKRSKHSVVAEKMQFIDSKNENSGMDNNSYQPYQPQTNNTMQETKESNIPSIDVDEELPF